MASSYDETQNGWYFPNSGVYYPTQAAADAAEQSPLRGRDAGQAYIRAQNPTQNFDWSQTQNPTITDKATGRVIQQGTNPSGDFGFEKYVLPAMMGAVGLGAAGLGPAAGAGGTTASAGAGEVGGAATIPSGLQAIDAGALVPPISGTDLGAISAGAGAAGGAAVGAGAGASYGGAGDYAAAPGSGMGSSVAAAGANDDIWSQIKQWLGPTGIPGISGANVLGTGLNYLAQTRAASQYGNLANTIRQSGSALYDPQRQQYQGQLSSMINDPSKYLTTDPFATSLTSLYKNNVIPRNVAASGNPASVLDQQGSQFVNALSADYGQKIGQLSGLGGFGFPPSGYTPSAVGAAGSGAIGAQATGIGGLANLFGQNFGQPPQGTSGTKGIFGTGMN